MATEKRKIYRVSDSAGTLVQQLPETSADQVTIADVGNKITATNVEGALQELATGIANAGKVDDVQNEKGLSLVTNKVAKITKASVGLENADNTADKDKSVKYATSAGSAGSATKATQDGSGNVITSTYATKTALQNGLAGKSQSRTYNSYQEFVSAVNEFLNTTLRVGDNVFIVTTDVPDMWVSAVNSTSTIYTYSTDSAIVTALGSTNGLTVGYYVFRKLETQKVDLTEYQKQTDNGLNTTNKTVVGAINEVKSTADSASAKASTNETAISNIVSGATFVAGANFATSATSATNASKLDHKISITAKGDITGSSSPSNLADNGVNFSMTIADGAVTTTKIEDGAVTTDKLSTTGVAKGTYSAVEVDTKGRVIAGGQFTEWGTSGQKTPSASLAVGGIFWELQ